MSKLENFIHCLQSTNSPLRHHSMNQEVFKLVRRGEKGMELPRKALRAQEKRKQVLQERLETRRKEESMRFAESLNSVLETGGTIDEVLYVLNKIKVYEQPLGFDDLVSIIDIVRFE